MIASVLKKIMICGVFGLIAAQTVAAQLFVEAEKMTLSTLVAKTFSGASNGSVDTVPKGKTGTATCTFRDNGTYRRPDVTKGTYDITVSYFDRQNAQCTFTLTVNGVQKDQWAANADDNARKVRKCSNVDITNGWIVKITAVSAGTASDYVDCLEFSPVFFRELRIAYNWNGYTMSDDFLKRARMLNYNRVIVGMCPTVSAAEVASMVQHVDSYGMRMIPNVAMSNCHSSPWICNGCCGTGLVDATGKPLLTNYNSHNTNDGNTSFISPSLADETSLGIHGIDYYYQAFLNNLRNGFSQAITSNSLKNSAGYIEYIHLGHDEQHCSDGVTTSWLLIGYGNVKFSQTDRNAISGFKSKYPSVTDDAPAFRWLLADELYRREHAIQDASKGNMPNTKTMIWADMWDPQQNGSFAYSTYLTTSTHQVTVVLAPNATGHTTDIIDLPYLSSTQKSELKANVVMMPWQYNTTYWANGKDYDSHATFLYFINNGYKMGFCAALEDQHENSTTQMQEYVSEYRKFAGNPNLKGYVATQWIEWDNSKSMYGQPWRYSTMDYLWKLMNGSDSRRAMSAIR